MSARLSRKDIKRDDFATAVERSVEYAESHTRMILYILGAIVVLGALAYGIRAFLGQRSAAASADLSRALDVYEAQIVPPGSTPAKPQDKEHPTFPDEASRRARAKQLFLEVRAKHGSTDAADVAGLYLAQIAVAEGKLEEAQKLWSEFVDSHKDTAPAAEARLNLYDLKRKQGKAEEVVGQLRPLLDDSSSPLPKDVVLYQLGLTYDALQRKQEAIGSYQRILDEFPQSPYRQEAQQKIATLDPSRALTGLGGAGGLGGSLPPGL